MLQLGLVSVIAIGIFLILIASFLTFICEDKMENIILILFIVGSLSISIPIIVICFLELILLFGGV